MGRLAEGYPAYECEVHLVGQLGVCGQDAQGTLEVPGLALDKVQLVGAAAARAVDQAQRRLLDQLELPLIVLGGID